MPSAPRFRVALQRASSLRRSAAKRPALPSAASACRIGETARQVLHTAHRAPIAKETAQ
jgi:hypothetical protein